MSREFEEHLVRFRNLPLPVRVVYGRPRTFIALAVGVIAFFLLPGTLRLPTRFVVGWDVFAALYLVLAYIMMLRCDVSHIRASAVLQDDGRFVMLLVTAVVWMGAPQAQLPMYDVGGITVFGGTYPARIWQAFMSARLAGQANVDMPPPGPVCDRPGALVSDAGRGQPLPPDLTNDAPAPGPAPNPGPEPGGHGKHGH